MKITIEIERAKGGGYTVRQDGELLMAQSNLPLLYTELGHHLRTTYNEGVLLPHATVYRDELKEQEQVQARPSRKPPEVPADRPSAYTMPNPKPDVRSLLDEQRERLNGNTTGVVDRMPAIG